MADVNAVEIVDTETTTMTTSSNNSSLITLSLTGTVVIIASSWLIFKFFENKGGKSTLYQVLLISTVLCVVAGAVCFYYMKNTAEEKGETLTFDDWFNSNINTKSILVGMVSGIVFGFVDNAGLCFGLSSLEKYMKNFPGGKKSEILSGYGNTFSDAVGAFLATFIGKIISIRTGISDYPIWSEAIGTIVGCLLGIYIPNRIMTFMVNRKLGSKKTCVISELTVSPQVQTDTDYGQSMFNFGYCK